MEFYDADTMLDDSCLVMTPPASSQPPTTSLAHETSPPPVTAPTPSTTGDDAELPTSESVVSSVSHGASVSTNSQLWEVEQASEITKCTSFSLKTCGCKMADGKPCSSLFSADYYVETRSQASLLTRQQLDLVLLGSVMTTTSVEKDVSRGRHKPTKRMRLSTQFMHRGYQLCKVTFNFLYGVGKHRVPAIRKSFVSDGLELRTHGNTRRKPHHASSFNTIQNVILFIQNYSEQNAILLPGRIPNQKRDDVKLLPSADTKKVMVKYLHVSY